MTFLRVDFDASLRDTRLTSRHRHAHAAATSAVAAINCRTMQ
jgi:hypothetical protein